MFNIEGGYDIPVTSRDIGMASLNNPFAMGMGMGFGLGMTPMMPMMPLAPMTPTYLNGVQMQKPIGEDKFMAVKAKKASEDKSVLAKAGLFLAACTGIGLATRYFTKSNKASNGVVNWMKTKWTSLNVGDKLKAPFRWISNLRTKTPPITP